MHGSSSCIKKSSFEAVVEVSDKEAHHEVTLEKDMDTCTSATADGIFQNAKQSYREVDKAVFVEKLKVRGKEPKPVRDDYNSVDDEVREITREHSSSPSPSDQHQSQGRKLSRSPPRDQQDCGSTSSTKKPAKKSSRKSSSSNTGSKDRLHHLLAEKRIPGFASDYTSPLQQEQETP